jgi:hypothetical protein
MIQAKNLKMDYLLLTWHEIDFNGQDQRRMQDFGQGEQLSDCNRLSGFK